MEGACVGAATSGAGEGKAEPLSAGERAAVPGEPGVECEAALGELARENLLERAASRRSGATGAVEGNAQPFGHDAEREERVELGEPGAQLLVARAEHEQDGVGLDD